MSDLPTRERIQDWLTLIDAGGGHPDAHGEWTVAVAYVDGKLQTAAEWRDSMVPDTRLQAVADAWKDYQNDLDPDIDASLKHRVFDLLAALAEGNNDE